MNVFRSFSVHFFFFFTNFQQNLQNTEFTTKLHKNTTAFVTARTAPNTSLFTFFHIHFHYFCSQGVSGCLESTPKMGRKWAESLLQFRKHDPSLWPVTEARLFPNGPVCPFATPNQAH